MMKSSYLDGHYLFATVTIYHLASGVLSGMIRGL